MELNDQHLKEKALLLLRRERELFDLRMKHEQVTLWLQLSQLLPLLLAPPHTAISDVYARLRKMLIEGLRLQRVCFFEVEGQTLRPLLPAGPPRLITAQALASLQSESGGFCNDPTDPSTTEVAQALELARFIWSRIDVPGRAPVVLAAGFDRAKAKFQSSFDAGDAAHLRNATQQVQGFIGNSLLTEELRAANETLEQRVKERTEELGRRNGDMRLVLDNVAQALLTIDRSGRLSNERSATADHWFGSYEGNPTFVDYIAHVDSDFAERFIVGHEALLEQVLPTEVCLKQLPSRLRAGPLSFHCTYRLISENGDASGLLIMINDVTEQVRLAQEEAEQSELLAVFRGLTRDRDGFLAFFEEANRLVEDLARGELDETTRSRHLHTLKGNAGMVGAKVIAELCHRAEDELGADGARRIETTMRRLQERWAAIKQTLEMVVGERATGIVEIPSSALEQLCDDIRRGASLEHVMRQLTLFRFEPVQRSLARLSQFAHALAQRTGKGGLSVAIEVGDMRIDRRRFGGLWCALVHVVRNAVDHGIEPAAERLARGKSAQGRLVLRAAQTDRELTIEIEDDGRGIDWTSVARLAAARGMPHQCEGDLVEAILSDGFSTRSKVSVTSGRGIGMSAVRAQVLGLGGAVSVQSEPGLRTCWRMTFPHSRAPSIRPAALAPSAS